MATSEFVPQPARYAIFVDAGYLYAASGALLLSCGSRREYRVAAEKLIKALTSHADEQLLGELLRVYWFDAAPKRQPTVDQRVIANLPLVKLRLGNLNAQGQQKGVDAQLRADLEALARHRAITDAVLLAGDEDMLPAVEAAQRYGVRVHLWGVEPTHGSNQAEWLVWESDTVEVLPAEFLRPYFTRAKVLPVPASDASAAVQDAAAQRTSPVPSPSQVFAGRPPAVKPPPGAVRATVPVPAGGVTPATVAASLNSTAQGDGKLGPDRDHMLEIGEHVAQKWIFERGRDNIRDLLPGPILPPVIDKELLIEAEKELGGSLRPYQEARTWLRDGFWERVYREFGIGIGKSD
ncbi:NYN domain-containing protein [Actinomadura hallensis]|uniref:NYN domain-containing protein n=1 Tax=Actinomadura hallensis TaxID=337895 RepID=A0A543ILL0_9ACTN|nr:NYN domain-containing protein [Actinomadura hallensis]TQM71461.1 NYN domain-containing protein [Actinomadura hallensis]HLV72432.1 NYN domain-containing protein [Vulgatibacteraceae bacterium]